MDKALVDLARFFVLFPFAMLMLMGLVPTGIGFGLFVYGLLNHPVLECLPIGALSLIPMAWTALAFWWGWPSFRAAIKQ